MTTTTVTTIEMQSALSGSMIGGFAETQ